MKLLNFFIMFATTVFIVIVSVLNNIPMWFMALMMVFSWVAWFLIGDE